MPEQLTSTDPATGETVATFAVASPEDVASAVEVATQAQGPWAARPVNERLEILERFADLVLDQRDEIAELITREAGKPTVEARIADVMPVLEMVGWLSKHGQRVLEGERFRLANPLLKDRTSSIRQVPVGVVGVIAPWNYPFSIPGTQLPQALFAGNAVVLKPSEKTPATGELLAELLWEAGVPQGVLHLVHGAAETGAGLTAAPVDLVLFTGSVATGRKIQAARAETLTPTILELGGKDPMIVLEDAKVGLAARGAVWGAFTNAGQTCAAVERVYVHEEIAEELTCAIVAEAEKLRLGPGSAPGVDVGPLIDQEAVDRCLGHLEDARAKGAHIATGGAVAEELGPRFLEPTVLTGVDHEMRVMQEETFGPLLPIRSVASADEAVELANDTPFGLSASIWTREPSRGQAIADRLEAGTITINDAVYTYAACETPWGGVKASGLGHTHGRWGLEALTRTKHVNTAGGSRRGSPWYYPYNEDLETLADEGFEFLYGSKLQGLKAGMATLRRVLGKPKE